MFPKAEQCLETVLLYGEELSINCLFCDKSFKPEPISKVQTEVDTLSKLFNTLSKYMKWESPLEYQFDFGEEQFPFCSSCSTIVVRVFKLDQQLQNVISDVIANIIDCGRQVVSHGDRMDHGTEKVQFYRRQTIFQHEPSVIPMTHEQPIKSENEYPDHAEAITAEQDPLDQATTCSLKMSSPSSPRSSTSAKICNVIISKDNSSLDEINCDQQTEKEKCKSSRVIPKKYKRSKVLPKESKCSIMLRKKSQLKHKIASNHLTCTLCQRSFTRTELLQRHEKAVHAAESSKKFVCEFCGNKYSRQYFLTSHMRIHRMAPCPTCRKVVTVNYMYSHMKTHNEGSSSY